MSAGIYIGGNCLRVRLRLQRASSVWCSRSHSLFKLAFLSREAGCTFSSFLLFFPPLCVFFFPDHNEILAADRCGGRCPSGKTRRLSARHRRTGEMRSVRRSWHGVPADPSTYAERSVFALRSAGTARCPSLCAVGRGFYDRCSLLHAHREAASAGAFINEAILGEMSRVLFPLFGHLNVSFTGAV